MDASTPLSARLLTVIACGAGPAPGVGKLVDLATAAGWRVQVVATPAGSRLVDLADLHRRTGTPVRADYRGAAARNGPRASAADAVVIAPATYNTVNKLAAGINDTYALNVAAEAIGRGTPTAVLPFVNTALAARAPFVRSVAALRDEGVHVVFGPGRWLPHQPGTGDQHLADFPWHAALAAVQP